VFETFAMPRRARVRAAQMAATCDVVPRVRRFGDLSDSVKKMNQKDSRTFEKDGVVFVHRCKKRQWLSDEEKAKVYCIFELFVV